MSEFLSNFITYVTAALFGTLCFLIGFDHASPPAEVVARGAETTPMVSESVLAVIEAPQFEEAKLEAVVFASSGVDQSYKRSASALPLGTVTGASVNLREGPGTGFAIAGKARGGQKLGVTGARDGIWFEVKTDLGETVWIHGKFFAAPTNEDGVVLAQN